MSAASDRSFPRHTHDQYGLGVIDRGAHASLSDQGQVEAGPGTLIAVNPGEVHDGRPLGGSPRSWRILSLEPALLRHLQGDVAEHEPRPFAFASAAFQDTPLRHTFNALFAAATAPEAPLAGLRCESLLLCLMARCTDGIQVRRAPALASPPLRQLAELIEAELAGDVRLARLAAVAGMSRFRLLRTFAAAYGLTPHAYVVQRRLARARGLIRAGCPLAEVASRCGFSDQSHLTRAFVRHLGVAPGGYAACSR